VLGSTTIALLTILFFVGFGFAVWSRLIERWVGVNPGRPTPAVRRNDGVDYVPTHPVVLFGHHLASIAGLGPIAGPAVAAVFGFLPGLLWILLATVFIGAVQDMLALFVSVRHGGVSIMTISGRYLGPRIRTFFLGVMLILLLVVNAVFGVLIALLWQKFPGTATATWVFVIAAIVTGLLLYRIGAGLIPSTLAGLALIAVGVWLGFTVPIRLGMVEWIVILMLYAYVASILPVWVLLQPRDYLNMYLLLSGIGGGIIGALLANYPIQAPLVNAEQAFRFGWDLANRPVWPYVSVLIACGAASGFHSLVSSGTTAKQIPNERYIRHIGYGAMLGEGFLGVVSLLAVTAALSWDEYLKLSPLAAAVTGWARFMNVLLPFAPLKILAIYIGLVATAFGFTTLDSSMRLTRYVIHELFGVRNIYAAGGIGMVLSLAIALGGAAFPLWTLFGSVNQVLVALALTTVVAVLAYFGKRVFYIVPGMAYMYATTITAMIHTAIVWIVTLPPTLAKMPVTSPSEINELTNPLIKAIYREYLRIYGDAGLGLANAVAPVTFALVLALDIISIVLALAILGTLLSRWGSIRGRSPGDVEGEEGVGPGTSPPTTTQAHVRNYPVDLLAELIKGAAKRLKALGKIPMRNYSAGGQINKH